ncbi:hypothetical protein BpHYR1_001115 [Brachionus plicatilis]|uniref:Uncharacterized protein n=1 Tax=Brachionus plicatilis TaxID=10195 RepID=A0A3M7S7X2_BRAPC|nr:hypothetical protein BpHYR1_001115 [Brachionus plicatilis]
MLLVWDSLKSWLSNSAIHCLYSLFLIFYFLKKKILAIFLKLDEFYRASFFNCSKNIKVKMV